MQIYSIAFIIASIFITSIFANTEKLILEARASNVESQCEPLINSPSLHPPFTKIQQSLIPYSDNYKGSSQWFSLDDLVDGANYEIRISYPAITPADFNLKIIHACQKSDGSLSYILDITARYTGVSYIRDMEAAPITYDLVLENLYLGFLFYQVYKIVISIIAVICLGQFFVIPRVKELITYKEK